MIGLCCLLPAIYFYLRGKAWLAVFILFFLMTAGFQMMPFNWMVLPPAGISKAYDWVLLFTGAILLLRPQVFTGFSLRRNFSLLGIYFSFLLLALVYSLFVREIEVSVVMRVFRNFIFFISLFLFLPLELPDLEKIWKGVIYATTIASVLYCLQPLLHVVFLNQVSNDLTIEDVAPVFRFYNVPVFICPVIFFLFFPGHTFSIRFRNLQLVINMLAILLTQHRNLMIAVVLCLFLYLILNKKIRPANAIIYCALCMGILIMADNFMGNRFSKGMGDLGNVSSAPRRPVPFQDITLSELSTTEFRKLLFMERLHYVLKDDARSVFGIGLMTDDSKKARALQFYIGVPDDDGNISQVANIDIAWASMLLQLGIVGTVLFILLHLALLKYFWSQRKDRYMQTGILYIVCLFIMSLYGSVIVMPYTMCMTMLFAAYYFCITPIKYRNQWQVSISR
jgi:hypothetical protein